MRFNSILFFIGMLMLASCKTNQPLVETAEPVNANGYYYTILVRVMDNGNAINEVIATIRQIIAPDYVKLRETTTDQFKVIQVMGKIIHEDRLNLLRPAVFKIEGVLEMNVYKNKKGLADQLVNF